MEEYNNNLTEFNNEFTDNSNELTETVVNLLSQLCGDIPAKTKRRVNELSEYELEQIKDSLEFFLIYEKFLCE